MINEKKLQLVSRWRIIIIISSSLQLSTVDRYCQVKGIVVKPIVTTLHSVKIKRVRTDAL